jgi:hypothetical protein
MEVRMKPVVSSGVLSLVAFLLPLSAAARETTQDTISTEAKIDSIYRLQKKMYRELKNEPLAGKQAGIEFNFIRPLIAEESLTLSGGVSLFSVNRRVEIAFPLYYSNPKDPKDLQEWTADCHLRYFLGNTQNGFYLSAFARFARLNGYLSDTNETLFSDAPVSGKDSQSKLGIGFGLGYRKFSYHGLYWGASFSIGRYLSGENGKFYGKMVSYDDDERQILDIEFLKFGWAF